MMQEFVIEIFLPLIFLPKSRPTRFSSSVICPRWCSVPDGVPMELFMSRLLSKAHGRLVCLQLSLSFGALSPDESPVPR